MNIKNKGKILTVCHDAGGAEVISAYVKKNKKKFDFVCLAVGPTVKIFKRKKLGKHLIAENRARSLLIKKNVFKMVLTGTSWASSIELDFIKVAKDRGIRAVSYLEHWKNYRERFGYPRRNWKKNLPDEIWLGDKYAFKLAGRLFSNLTLKLVPNLYFKEIKEEFKKIRGKIGRKKNKGILFLSEPLASQINCFGDKGGKGLTEFDILGAILSFLVQKNPGRRVIIRFHPSEKKNKYDDILSRYGRLKIVKSKNKNILKDLNQVKLVIGMDSMALVISYLCGKKTISFLPPGSQKSYLPFKEIIKIRRIKDLEKKII